MRACRFLAVFGDRRRKLSHGKIDRSSGKLDRRMGRGVEYKRTIMNRVLHCRKVFVVEIQSTTLETGRDAFMNEGICSHQLGVMEKPNDLHQ